jgi:uncharacterized protein
MAGIGWRHPHYGELLTRHPKLDFVEVHSENFFAAGGAALSVLLQGREHYELSLHGVGLSLGSAMGLDPWHLDQLAALVHTTQPLRVSDHACFARVQSNRNPATVHAADLLPIPFTSASLDVLCSNVNQVQDALGRSIAVENLSAYVTWPWPTAAYSYEPTHAPTDASLRNAEDECLQAVQIETEFLNQLSQRTGCQLLVDLNNVYVNALNAQKRLAAFNHEALSAAALNAALAHSMAWVRGISPQHIAEIHLAGHQDTGAWVVDDHGSRVCDPVWTLYQQAAACWQGQLLQPELQRLSSITLIEWDTDIPELEVLLQEAARADALAQSSTTPTATNGTRA